MTKLTATHGVSFTNSDDGVTREVDVYLLTNGRYAIKIRTIWEDNEPVDTQLSLTPAGMKVLTEALIYTAHHMHNHAIVDTL